MASGKAHGGAVCVLCTQADEQRRQTPFYGRAKRVLVVVCGLVVMALLATSGWLPIPNDVSRLFTPAFTGSAATAQPIGSFTVPQHPYLARNGANSMHNDAYATDAYAGPGPLGVSTVVTSAWHGLSECATLTFNRLGQLVGLCGDLLGPQLKLIDPVKLSILDSYRLPGRVLRSGVSPLEDLCGGAYFYLDHQDRAVVATTGREIHVISPAFEVEQVIALDVPDCLIALMPDWSGRIWFVTNRGVGVVGGGYLNLGETIANSLAVDEHGGVFVVSDHALYRFEGSPHRMSWRQEYDRGTAHKPGQLSQGSGTTPTLMGGDRIAITDNADDRMNVLVYRRSDGGLICSEPVFRSHASATENSLIAVGDSLIVENNHGYTGPMSTMLGGASEPGVARVDVTDGRCSTAWTSSEVAPSSVPKASLATGLVYVYAKVGTGWYLSAIDIRTGRTAFRVLTGTGVLWNNHYAAITLGPDGAAYIATLAGMVRIADHPL